MSGGGLSPWQDLQTRLYNRQKCFWKNLVHEVLIYPSRIELINYILHKSSADLQEAFARSDTWTTMSAMDRVKAGRKTSFWKIIIAPIAVFLYRFILLRGFLDGKIGWQLAWGHAKDRLIIEKKMKIQN